MQGPDAASSILQRSTAWRNQWQCRGHELTLTYTVLDRRTGPKPPGVSTITPQNSCVKSSHAVGRSFVVRRMQLPMSSRQLLDTQSGIGGNSSEVAM
mmetsp:Transcript_40133/g.128870  ORF Transcript_40133/g.128870 Transcript_40133/m.128870 type:complete len:97 (+) Transcript_40133:320-610(+)